MSLDEVYDQMIGIAASLNVYVDEARKFDMSAAAKFDAPGKRPGDAFNARAEWGDILTPHGWKAVSRTGDTILWKRPGKDAPGCSATTGHCRTDTTGDQLYVFSTNAAPFDDGKCYCKFAAHALLNHNANFAAAAGDLAAKGFGSPKAEPLSFSRNGNAPKPPKPSAGNSADPLDADATAADLIEQHSIISWLWEGWIPLGSLTILASEPGCGKTRFCADLLRRITNGLPWPDGTKHGLPLGSTCLWVPADNHHAELGTFPEAFSFPANVLYLNTTRRNPFGGTMLDEAADLTDFRDRLLRVKPVCVFIDTCLNATDRSAHKPEDAKAFFKPLSDIATLTRIPIVCVTHLNAAGKPLGRRIEGQGRVVIMLEKPDASQEHRRKLWVRKSHSVTPPALGVTMGTHGNEYDSNPPCGPDDEPGADAKTTGRPSHTTEDCDWLRAYLASGPKRVSYTRTDAESEGISSKRLYRAKFELDVEEFEAEGRKWWRLTATTFDKRS